MTRDDGGGLSRSSAEIGESRWSEGLSLFEFQTNQQPQGMIDYNETKSQPITRVMVIQAYGRVKSNRGSAGIDRMSWVELENDLSSQLYKLWNRLTSGSYHPQPVKEVSIKKKDGGERKLGIPTILDRVAQEVVRNYLEKIVEPLFHHSSYGYRPQRNCHQAVAAAVQNSFQNHWAIDLDIKSFFDTIDHDLLMQAVSYYCKDKWVLMYIERWLKAGIVQQDGTYVDRLTGTPQGGVISPLLANIFLHVVFDKWMAKEHSEKPFERYADDIVVHCKTEKQAKFLLREITARFKKCKLIVHPTKTKIIQQRGSSENKYARSFDFLGFTIRPWWGKTTKGYMLLVTCTISKESEKSVLEKFRKLKIHKRRISIEKLAEELTPIISGVKNYYCKFWSSHTHNLWHQLNTRLVKWAMWEKGLCKKDAMEWIKKKYKENNNLFPHWVLAHP